eukprot:gene1177-2289_t
MNLNVLFLRIITLFTHFLITTFIVWVHIDQIQIVTPSDSEYKTYADTLQNLCFAALVLLGIELLLMGFVFRISLFSMCIHISLDILGSFLTLWMILDGLDWRIYPFVFIVCVFSPFLGDLYMTNSLAQNDRYLFDFQNSLALFTCRVVTRSCGISSY